MKKFSKILFILILLVFIIILFYHLIMLNLVNNYNLKKSATEMNETLKNSPFSISKVMVYSSAYGENKNTTFQQSNWILDIFQYSDIAVYIDNGKTELNSENTIKKLWLDNIKISDPKIGSPSLYFLDTLNFGTANFQNQNKLQENLDFTVFNDENSENNLSYNTPTFFADCSNPITLKYVNHSIKNDFQITSNEPVSFNGKLLEMAEISLDDLATTIQFNIHLVNYNNEEFDCNFSLPIELQDDKNSILDGKIFVENSFENMKFLKKIE